MVKKKKKSIPLAYFLPALMEPVCLSKFPGALRGGVSLVLTNILPSLLIAIFLLL